MQLKNATISFTSYEVIDVNGNSYDKIVHAPEKLGYSELLKDTVIGCLTVMVDRNKFSDLMMPNISSRQPLVVWLRILKTGCVAFGLDKILAKYRVVQGSVSHDKLKAAKNVWHVYRDYEDLNFIKTCYYFYHYSKNGFLRNINRIFKKI
jgi:teichuronic acid biosynthesis glycosyltransferase TuaG